MALGDYTDGDIQAMEVFSQRVLGLVEDLPGGAVRRTVEPACAGGLDECGGLVKVDADVTQTLRKFITDVTYGFSAYASFVQNESKRYFDVDTDARKVMLNDLGKWQATGLPQVAPKLLPPVDQPK